jgi:hypothetical protein
LFGDEREGVSIYLGSRRRICDYYQGTSYDKERPQLKKCSNNSIYANIKPKKGRSSKA